MSENNEALDLDTLREELNVKAIVLVITKRDMKCKWGSVNSDIVSSGLLDKDLIKLIYPKNKNNFIPFISNNNFIPFMKWNRSEKLDDFIKKVCINNGVISGLMLTVSIIEDTPYLAFGIYKLSDFGLKETVRKCIDYIECLYE